MEANLPYKRFSVSCFSWKPQSLFYLLFLSKNKHNKVALGKCQDQIKDSLLAGRVNWHYPQSQWDNFFLHHSHWKPSTETQSKPSWLQSGSVKAQLLGVSAIKIKKHSPSPPPLLPKDVLPTCLASKEADECQKPTVITHQESFLWLGSNPLRSCILFWLLFCFYGWVQWLLIYSFLLHLKMTTAT